MLKVKKKVALLALNAKIKNAEKFIQSAKTKLDILENKLSYAKLVIF